MGALKRLSPGLITDGLNMLPAIFPFAHFVLLMRDSQLTRKHAERNSKYYRMWCLGKTSAFKSCMFLLASEEHYYVLRGGDWILSMRVVNV